MFRRLKAATVTRSQACSESGGPRRSTSQGLPKAFTAFKSGRPCIHTQTHSDDRPGSPIVKMA